MGIYAYMHNIYILYIYIYALLQGTHTATTTTVPMDQGKDEKGGSNGGCVAPKSRALMNIVEGGSSSTTRASAVEAGRSSSQHKPTAAPNFLEELRRRKMAIS
jgi:hypothetical protein